MSYGGLRRKLVITVAPLWLLCCAAVAGLEDHRPFPAEGGTDANTDSGKHPPKDGMSDGTGTSHDYGDLHDPSRWEFFDTASLSQPNGYQGGAFAGHFVYFAAGAGRLLRYDTAAAFTSATSWTLAMSPNIPAPGEGLVALGPYVYETPAYQGNSVGRYDTTQTFDAGAAAFSTYEPKSVANIDFRGGCTDGKIVYFVPFAYYNGPMTTAFVGTLLTYDPAGAGFFTDSSWTVTALGSFNPAATGLATCVFDGQYVYFGNNQTGTTARYDTTQAISSSSAWVFFQVTMISGGLYGFDGLVYTGRYIVYVPNYTTAYSAAAVAYDTTGKFGEVASWTPYNLGSTDGGASAAGYSGGQFDGRYVYMAPTTTGLVVRWDSTQPFDRPSAWEVYDVNALHAGAKAFYGTAFDGEYVYFSTIGGSAMARFRARNTTLHPTRPSSFF